MDPLLDGIKLSILVFGPSPLAAAGPGYNGDLARKRIEIKTALAGDGHKADFPEDLMVGSFDPKLCNAHLFEQHLVRQYDLVVIFKASSIYCGWPWTISSACMGSLLDSPLNIPVHRSG
jgi:hypothetical protein